MNKRLKDYAVEATISDSGVRAAVITVMAESKAEAIIWVVNSYDVLAVYGVERVDFHHDRDLTPAQAEALDAAAARPPIKIKARDLPSRKRKG